MSDEEKPFTLKRRENAPILNPQQAILLQAIDTRLKDFGYTMLVPDQDLRFATLPSGAIVVMRPGKKPISVLINNIDHIPDNAEPYVS